jgi:hypothetical protein
MIVDSNNNNKTNYNNNNNSINNNNNNNNGNNCSNSNHGHDNANLRFILFFYKVSLAYGFARITQVALIYRFDELYFFSLIGYDFFPIQ